MRVAAIDQGTTSTRCLVVEDGGAWHLAASRRHAQQHPEPGWVEHDPEELIGHITEVLASAGPVDAIALANQGESCLAWDARTKQPLSNVIVWQDARTRDQLAALPAQAHGLSRQICGLPLDAYFSASKLAWLLKYHPDIAAAHKAGRLRLGTTDAFFLDRLCGCFRTDLATASRTGLLDLETGNWSEELCALHGVPPQCLPEIVSVDGGFGEINHIPVKVSIVDQQAALFGHGCRNPGDCKITFGTGAFLLAVAGEERPDAGELLPTIAWQQQGAPPLYAIEGGVYDAGAALEWACRLDLVSTLEELNQVECTPSALRRGLVFIPALSGLAAPWWDREAAPILIGMRHTTNRDDILCAMLEGIALMTAHLLTAATWHSPSDAPVSIDGGLSKSNYFAQFLASASQRPICVPHMHELTALGLAELCGLDVARARTNTRMFYPDNRITDADKTCFARALEKARHWRS